LGGSDESSELIGFIDDEEGVAELMEDELLGMEELEP